MLRRVLPIIGRSIADLWDNILVLVAANVLWALSALPGVVLFLLGSNIFTVLGLIILEVLLLGPATLALFYLTSEVSRREHLELREFFIGLKRFYKRGWAVAGLNGFFLLLAYFNLVFYSSGEVASSPISVLSILWVYVLLVWLTMQLYLWPLALRMEQLKIGLLLRNTALATLKYPFYSLLMTLFLLILAVISFLLGFVPTVIFGAAFHILVSNKALTAVLEREQSRLTAQTENSKLKIQVSDLKKGGRTPPGEEVAASSPPEVTQPGDSFSWSNLDAQDTNRRKQNRKNR